MGLINWFRDLIGKLLLHMEDASRDRFKRWSAFLGRKMFLALVFMVSLLGVYLTILGLILWRCGVAEATKAFVDTWTGLFGIPTILVGLYGAAAGTNVLEHRENTKVKVAAAGNKGTGTETGTEDPPPEAR